MGITRNYQKAKQRALFADKNQRFKIKWREVRDERVVHIEGEYRKWEIQNLLDTINPIAFISLKEI